MEIRSSVIDKKERYKLLSGSILPRPIAFVSTISKDGVPNLAPFSFFTGVTGDPPTLCFAPNLNSDGSKKDTLLNIENTGEFAVHVVGRHIAEAMDKSAANFATEVNEFKEVGLSEAPAQTIAAPRIKEADICMECKLLQVVPVASTGFLVIGEVQHFYFADGILENGYVRADKLDVVGRWAGYDYIKGGETFRL